MDMTAIRGNWCPGKSYKKKSNKSRFKLNFGTMLNNYTPWPVY